MEDEAEYREAKSIALRFLSYRPRSEREVRDRLRQKGISAQAAAAVIAELKRLQYLDDSQFARLWVESRQQSPRGPLRLRQELAAKGIAPELIDPLLLETFEAVGELELARTAAARKLRTMPEATREERGRRIGQYLQRQGFSYAVIIRALRELEPED